MPFCVVKGCTSGKGKDPSTILHVFPGNIYMIKKWLQQTGQDFGNLAEYANKILEGRKNASHRMCSKHFTLDSYLSSVGRRKNLLRNAVPTIFLESTLLSLTVPRAWPFKRKHVKAATLSPQSATESCATCGHPYLSQKGTVENGTNMENIEPEKKNSGTNLSKTVNKLSVHRQARKRRKITSDCEIQCNLLDAPSTVELLGEISRLDNVSTNEQSYNPLHVARYTPTIDKLKIVPPIASSTSLLTDEQPSSNTRNVSFQPSTSQTIHTVEEASMIADDESLSSLLEDMSSDETRPSQCDTSFRISQHATSTSEEEEVNEQHLRTDLVEIKGNHPVDYIHEKKYIVYDSCLDKLFLKMTCQAHEPCGEPVLSIAKMEVGSAVTVYGKCNRGHTFHLWDSQPAIH